MQGMNFTPASMITMVDREAMTSHIVAIFNQRSKGGSAYNAKFPDFVKRLEENIFQNAKTKEEYTDLSTLESRLHDVARRLNNKPSNAQGSTSQSQVANGMGLGAGNMPQNGTQPGGMIPNMGAMMQQQQQQHQMQQSQQQGQGVGMPAGGMPGAGAGGGGYMPQGSMPMQNGFGQQMPGMQMGDNSQNFMGGGGPPPGGMIPTPNGNGPGSFGGGMMSNGAPVLIRGNAGRDWNASSSQPMPGNSGPGGMGMMPGSMGPGGGMVPQQPNQVPQQPNFMLNGPNGMVPMSNAMVPMSNAMVPMGQGPGPSPQLGMGMGMGSINKHSQQQGQGPGPGSGMVPMGGGGPGMVPVGGMGPGPGMGNGNLGQGMGMGMGPMGMGMGMGMNSNGPMGPGGMGPGPGGPMGPGPGMGMGPGPGSMGQIPMGPGGGSMGMPAGMMPNPMGMGPGAAPAMPAPPAQANQMNNGGGGGLVPPEQLNEPERQHYVQKQQRWLLFLRHCAKCRQNGDECQLKTQCKFGKQLWQHILSCQTAQCNYPRCTSSKDLLKHHQKCQTPSCPICAPVKDYVRKTRMQNNQSQQQQQQAQQQQPLPQLPQPQQQQPQQSNTQQHAQSQSQNNFMGPGPGGMGMGMPMGMGMHPMMGPGGPMGPMGMQQGMGPGGGQPMNGPPMGMQQQQLPPNAQGRGASSSSLGQKRPHSATLPGYGSGQNMGMAGPGPSNAAPPEDCNAEKKPKRPINEYLSENTGTSLLETFDANLIRMHVELIRAAASSQRSLPGAMSEALGETCKVCRLARLTFDPPLLYCNTCGLKIKRGASYYSTPSDTAQEYRGTWCSQCYNEAKGECMPDHTRAKKTDLQKLKNEVELEEGWVFCDACDSWVHQICGLFNKGRNNKDDHYNCPDCLLKGLDLGVRKRIEQRPQSMLEGKDLPSCKLSDMITERLNIEIARELQLRAAGQGKSVHEIPPHERVEGLTVRVVCSGMKKCETKPKFYETFQSEHYPSEFPYRQRVLVLFQNLDGVDVCLFCMYVQEYGRDSPPPNTNVVYLSYLDSVKYFRPEVPSAFGPAVALRSYVYHQLLIAYLQFVKKLGFEQMYIWACPPMAGDDYILYCHPSRQKTPRSERLRVWYIDMLKRAKEEGIVTHLSTLWDMYFEGGRDHRYERCSSINIPYLEGDYWPGEAENQLATIADAQRGGSKGAKGAGPAVRKGAKGKRYGTGPATTDEQLMSRLGETFGGPMREDFIVAHMQEVCTFCRVHVHGGGVVYRFRIAPGQTPPKAAPERKFEGIKLEGGVVAPNAPVTRLTLCQNCYGQEHQSYSTQQPSRLPAGVTPMDLYMEKLEPQEQWPCDPDPNIENEFFETRQTFLSLCQGNHYQFDTLRRAKHSSMMVLYHLHNPSAPAFTTSCNVCGLEVEPGQGYRCTVCQDFDLCSSCKVNIGHPHPLQRHVAAVDETRMRLSEAERRERMEQLARTMALLVHACSCNVKNNCTSTSCRKVKQLCAHAVGCTLKVTGGCALCKKMWGLLNLHAKSCTRGDCPVPRCKELKELRRRQTNRQEEQRRAAYLNMLRQQAASQAPAGRAM